MAYCSECKNTITCPGHAGHNHSPIDSVSPCPEKCSIWVRVLSEAGVPLQGLKAAGGGKTDISAENGFAKMEDLKDGTHTVSLDLAALKDTYQPLETASREETLGKGDLKLITVKLKPKVAPLIELSETVIAVDGETATITLKTDLPHSGPGILTCVAGQGDVAFDPPLTVGKLTVDSADAGKTVTVTAKNVSALEGVRLTWGLEDKAVQRGPDADAALTAMTARLVFHNGADNRLDKDRVVHLQNDTAERTRARTMVKWQPLGVTGSLKLRNEDGKLKVFSAKTEGAETDTIEMTAEQGYHYVYLEGATVSAGKDDAKLILDIVDKKTDADTMPVTVVKTVLELCAPRQDAATDPTPLSDTAKQDPGRAVFLQGDPSKGGERASSRAKIRVLKTPIDAPCEVVLAVAGDKLTLWDQELPNAKDDPKDASKKKEEKVTLPVRHAPDAFTNGQGKTYWVEGAKATDIDEKVMLSLNVTDVDDKTDFANVTVRLAKIELEIQRIDLGPPSGGGGPPTETKVDLSTAVKVGTKLKETGDVTDQGAHDGKAVQTYEVAPGSYLFQLELDGAEKGFTILRTVPEPPKDKSADQSKQAAVVVKEGDAPTKVKFELRKPPEYKKFQFIGYEIKSGKYVGLDATPNDEDEARKDLLGRCKIMKEAMDAAHTNARTKHDDEVLKIFMAPEFYFRGQQGAYPVSMLSEIIDDMGKHAKDPKFNDWLFVYGSAIGMLPVEGISALGNVTAVNEMALGPNQFLAQMYKAPAGGDTLLQEAPSDAMAQINAVTDKGGGAYLVTLNTPLPVPNGAENLWFDLTGAGNWQNLGAFVRVGPNQLHCKFPNPPVAGNIVCIRQWPQQSCTVTGVQSLPNHIYRLTLDKNLPAQRPNEKFWHYRSTPPALNEEMVFCTRNGLVLVEGTFNEASIPEGAIVTQTANGSRGYVYGSNVDTGNKKADVLLDYRGSPAPHLPALPGDLKLSAQQNEVFNVVFIQRGGSGGTAMNSDGSTALRDLLIYKESVSSVDFEGDDYATQRFYGYHRHATKLSGDVKTTIPTHGSRDVRGANANVVGQPRKDDKGAATGTTTSERTESGLGGGGLFKMDEFEFGVDVCLDHGNGRLKQSGATVDIHLIPSCGMSIKNTNVVARAEGYVFNVDAYQTSLQQYHTAVAAPPAIPFEGADRDKFFNEGGKIFIYDVLDKTWT